MSRARVAERGSAPLAAAWPAVGKAASGGAARGRRRLVAVNRSFWPDNSATGQLLADLAEHLAGAGWEVEVVASRARYDDPAVLLPPREVRGRVRVRRLPVLARRGRRSLPGRFAEAAWFHVAAAAALLGRVRPGDVLLAKTDPPLIGATAALVARLRGAVLVNWCQDVFPEIAAAVTGGSPAGGATGAPLRAAGRASWRAAAANVVPHASVARHLAARGVPADRIAVVPNWPDAGVRPVPRAANRLRAAWGLDGDSFVVGYSGNLGRIHEAPAVLELALRLRDEPGLVLLFVGGGAGLARVRRAAAERGLAHVRFLPYQPRGALAESLSVPDLHLVALSPACEGLAFPSKLAGAMAAGRPVLFLGDPEGSVAREVRAARAGEVLDAGRPDEWLAQVRGLRRDGARYEEAARNARAAYEAGFTARGSLALWSGLLDPLAAAAPAAARRRA